MNITDFKKVVQTITWKISPKLSCTLSYFHNRGKLPNFNNPKDLSEIVFSQMITSDILAYVPYVDKVMVRDYICEWGLEEYLPKIYGIWEKGADIDFNVLPEKFALKANNFCGGHLFCLDKSKFDFDKARLHMDNELKKVTTELREAHYNNITPKVYAEELLLDSRYVHPIDYKFHCCDGVVKGCLVCSGRGSSEGFKLTFYDTNWVKRTEFLRGPEKTDEDFEKPQNFEAMMQIAEKISKHFEQVRVDLYNINGKIYIGELTFTPEGGMMSYYTNEALSYLGHEN